MGNIDESIITESPLLLGGGVRLFGELNQGLELELADMEVMLNQLVRRHYRRN